MGKAVPIGLLEAGAALWNAVIELHELDPIQCCVLEEACRAKDRLDTLHAQLADFAGDEDTERKILVVANATANTQKQLFASLRLPDVETGKRPQARGGARGAYRTGATEGSVSSIDRARSRRGA